MSNLSTLLTTLVAKYELEDKQDMVLTEIPGVHFFHSTQTTPRTPVSYKPGMVIIFQGSKTAYLANHVYHYDASQYLLLTVPSPLECETTASKSEPLLGMFIDLDLNKLNELVLILATEKTTLFTQETSIESGISAGVYDEMLTDVIHRLLKSLQSSIDAKVLGPSLVHEIFYRLLRGYNGAMLYALTQHDGHYARISKILDRIHKDYAATTTVEEYACLAGMSVSAFHRAFKQVTQESPLQYVKKIKLFKAKTLIIHEGVSTSVAANRVGYESASQFSREFKRFFKVTPSQSKSVGYSELR